MACLLGDRYSTVKPRNLPHTWIDREELLIHVMFEVLSNFVEKELRPHQDIDWDCSEYRSHARDEMEDLYRWWHEEYSWRDEDFVSLQADEAWYAFVTHQCLRLSKIRGYMWS